MILTHGKLTMNGNITIGNTRIPSFKNFTYPAPAALNLLVSTES